jgi:hypothetical protein
MLIGTSGIITRQGYGNLVWAFGREAARLVTKWAGAIALFDAATYLDANESQARQQRALPIDQPDGVGWR